MFGLGFGDGLGLWLSSGHLLLSGDGLGLGFLGYGFGVRGRKVKSRDCALASDLVLVRAISVAGPFRRSRNPSAYRQIQFQSRVPKHCICNCYHIGIKFVLVLFLEFGTLFLEFGTLDLD